jgi:hypothetical protein
VDTLANSLSKSFASVRFNTGYEFVLLLEEGTVSMNVKSFIYDAYESYMKLSQIHTYKVIEYGITLKIAY